MYKEFRIETHLHTREASACAGASGAEMVRAHKAAGYDALIVTDHFFNGNTAISADLPWEERVARFCKGYENALDEAGNSGFKVFFGWEYGYHATEFLTYGLDKAFLLAHPDLLDWPLETYFAQVRAAGGMISHAHPFREAPYITEIRLYPAGVDAVEVANASHTEPRYDRRALEYARANHLAMTAGSDTHHADQLYGGGMVFKHPLQDVQEFICAVMGKEWLP